MPETPLGEHKMVKVKSSVWKNSNTDLQSFSYHLVYPILSQATVPSNPVLKFHRSYFKTSLFYCFFIIIVFYFNTVSLRNLDCTFKYGIFLLNEIAALHTECQIAQSKDYSEAPLRL